MGGGGGGGGGGGSRKARGEFQCESPAHYK